MRNTFTLSTVCAAILLLAGEAGANDSDRAACSAAGLGDDCVRHNGDAGSCVPDASDPTILTCEDAPAGGSTGVDDNGGSSSDDGAGTGDDHAACSDLQEGEACVRTDGSAGTCVPDDSDPAALECEDDSSGTSASDDGGGTSDDDASTDSGGDHAACAALAQGDACTRSDGRDGSCVPDAGDPDVLECDDEASPAMDGSAGNASTDGAPINLSCSVGSGKSPTGLLALLMLVGFARRRRTSALRGA